MRSPLEMMEGRFEHALLTTYSFNLQFFEKWVLRALWAARVRNVVVFVDPTRLGEALDDREASLAGRAYDLVAIRRARLAFHPKLILLSGTEGHRLCVSSANLTADGQLRNLEAGVCFDSGEPEHRKVIGQGAKFLHRISQEEECPPHTVELVDRATRHAVELDGPEGRYSFIHNLDEPLSTHFAGSAAVRATAPYATVEAARKVGASGLDVIVDGENFAAPSAFFDGPWRIEARRFERRLHGKAYWIGKPEGGDLIVGSPNLSGAALLRTADTGNVEGAIAIRGGAGELSPPPGAPWTEGDLRDAAASRFEAATERGEGDAPTSFNAWVEDGRLKTSGVPNGTEIEAWGDGLWITLGRVGEGEIATGERPPTRIRALIEGRTAYAIVALPSRLRRRAASGASSDEAGSAAELPLDLETVRVLESVLGELYELSGRIAVKLPPHLPRPGPDGSPSSGGLEEWRPRFEGDEPRIPPLYLDEWQGRKDALLTLVSRVLHIDEGDASPEPQEVVDEHIEIDELEAVAGGGSSTEDEDEDEDEQPLTSTREELGKYRHAFDRLLARGEEFVSEGQVDELVSTAFVYLLRLIEELEGNTVEVDEEPEPLGDPSDMLEARAELLIAFQAKEIEDRIAMRAAGPHLASCLREIDGLDSITHERIERVAFDWASDLLEAAPVALSSDDEAALASYAERSRWPWIAKAAAENLTRVELTEHPFPLICGCGRFEQRLVSPAWGLIAFAAPAGLEDIDPFAFAVINGNPESPAAAHIMACDPGSHLLLEAMKRRTDGQWVIWPYDCHSRLDLERFASVRPNEGDRKGPPVDFDDLADAPEPVGAIAMLVDRYCSSASPESSDQEMAKHLEDRVDLAPKGPED